MNDLTLATPVSVLEKPSPSLATQSIEELIRRLHNGDGLVRQSARRELVTRGGPDITRAFIVELNDPRSFVRWEAAKALIAIADPVAAPALVHHFRDQDHDIRWLAAEGIAGLGMAGLLETLNAAIRNASDHEFCISAHHAFKEFHKRGVGKSLLKPVIESCEHGEPGVALPVAAYHVLTELRLAS